MSLVKSVDSDKKDDIHLLLITGISLFSKLNLFSGLNQLTDISLDKDVSKICGYTEQDLKTVFAEVIEFFDFEEIRQ